MTDLRQEIRECERLAAELTSRIERFRLQVEEPISELDLSSMESSVPVSESFGHRLRVLRAKKALTQVQLADRSGLTVNTIIKLENDQTIRPQALTVRRIADALGVDESRLEA